METNFKLIYDVAAMSEAPKQALALGGVVLGVVALGGVWQLIRGGAYPLPMKFLLIIAGIMALLGVGLEYEKRWIANRESQEVVGQVWGHWEKRERERAGSNSYWYWEGFAVGDKQFSYRRNVSQNYFHNAGPEKVEIRDGMMVRVKYVLNDYSGKMYPEIVRFEVGDAR